MVTITNYVPTNVGPSKLEQVLAWCVELSDESKERVCIITDIARLGKLLGKPQLSTHNFYYLYDLSITVLEAVQHNLQVDYNTQQYHARYTGSL